MTKHLFLFIVCTLLCSACRAGLPEGKEISLPELGISITIPEAFSEAGAEELTSVQVNNAAAEPLKPFQDHPYTLFRGPNGESLLISKLTLLDPSFAWTSPEHSLYEYHRSLENHYNTTIPAEDAVNDRYSTVLLRLSFVTGQGTFSLDRGLYHYGDGRYLMVDLYSNKEALSEAEKKVYDRIFRSFIVKQ
ncbi:MAG: hypothetical protein LBP23_03755 [Treponema sp.]|jgi:hypothetical protein|nr:hypothetical protein [Treponema sp.]